MFTIKKQDSPTSFLPPLVDDGKEESGKKPNFSIQNEIIKDKEWKWIVMNQTGAQRKATIHYSALNKYN